MNLNLPDQREIRQTFDRTAGRYDQHAALEQEVGSRLLERLEFQRQPAERILDLGCGTGLLSAELKKQMRKAQVIGLDSSCAMLSQLRKRSNMLRPLKMICSDFSRLPIADRSVDLVISNLSFHWCEDPLALFNEIRRVLTPDGMMLFSTLGTGSLNELGAAWDTVDEEIEEARFVDILELGDAMMSAGFQQPVMDAERLTLTYPDLNALLGEIDVTGLSLFFRGEHDLKHAAPLLERGYAPYLREGRYPMSLEVVYGTAFGPEDGQPRKTSEGDVATFSVDALRKAIPRKS